MDSSVTPKEMGGALGGPKLEERLFSLFCGGGGGGGGALLHSQRERSDLKNVSLPDRRMAGAELPRGRSPAGSVCFPLIPHPRRLCRESLGTLERNGSLGAREDQTPLSAPRGSPSGSVPSVGEETPIYILISVGTLPLGWGETHVSQKPSFRERRVSWWKMLKLEPALPLRVKKAEKRCWVRYVLPLMSLFLPPLSEFTVQAASSLTGLVLLRFRAAPAAYGRSQFPG